jgi:ribonuclease III
VSDLATLQQKLDYTFKNEGLLRLALTHPSIAHEASTSVPHNQRLEFLGDSVLGLVLTHELYEKFEHISEGPLTKARAQLVNRRTLAEQAQRLDLGKHLILSHGEESSGGRARESNLADAFEALLAAIFLDGGYRRAREFILRHFREAFGDLSEIPSLDNPKGELQEALQADAAEPPRYELKAMTGPDHDRMFECAVYHAGRELGRGRGKSKKAAESDAALAALRNVRRQRKE